MMPRSHSLIFLVLLAGFFWVGTPASAQVLDDDEDTEWIEAFVLSEMVFPQERGEMQVALMPQMTSGNGETLGFVPFGFEYGLTDTWQVEFELDSFQWGEAPAVDGLEVGTMLGGLRLREGTYLATGVEAFVPLAEEAAWEVEPFALLAQRVGLRTLLTLQATRALEVEEDIELSDAGEEEEAPWSTVLGAYHTFSSWAVTTELAAHFGGETTALYAAPGVAWMPGDAWTLGLGLPIGLTESAQPLQVAASIIFEFELGKAD